ncbi:hypothetical protein IWZ00DRAFT_361287 [Phyllosticta capitalensis]|uniref:Uncharacterized protein n=1 Tax=Phyllosticta capitalensis TaxID=121624 RepID=A0ABR1Y9Z0_9PEZI
MIGYLFTKCALLNQESWGERGSLLLVAPIADVTAASGQCLVQRHLLLVASFLCCGGCSLLRLSPLFFRCRSLAEPLIDRWSERAKKATGMMPCRPVLPDRERWEHPRRKNSEPTCGKQFHTKKIPNADTPERPCFFPDAVTPMTADDDLHWALLHLGVGQLDLVLGLVGLVHVEEGGEVYGAGTEEEEEEAGARQRGGGARRENGAVGCAGGEGGRARGRRRSGGCGSGSLGRDALGHHGNGHEGEVGRSPRGGHF